MKYTLISVVDPAYDERAEIQLRPIEADDDYQASSEALRLSRGEAFPNSCREILIRGEVERVNEVEMARAVADYHDALAKRFSAAKERSEMDEYQRLKAKFEPGGRR